MRPASSPFTTIIGLLREYPWHFVGACFFGACAAVFALTPYLFAWMTTLALLEGLATRESFLTAAALLFAGIVLRHLCFAASTTLSHFAAFGIQVELRRRMIKRLFRVPLGLLSHDRESRWRSALLDDVESIEDGLAHLIPEVAAIVGGLAMCFAVMLWADWRLACAAMLPLVTAAVLMLRMQRRANEAVVTYRKTWERMNEASAELARGVAVLKVFDEGQVSARFHTASRDFLASVREWVRLCLVPSNIFSTLISSSLVAVLPLGLVLIGQARSAPSDVLLVIFLCLGLSDNFVRLTELVARIGRQGAALQRIGEVMAAPQVTYGEHPIALTSTDVAFDDVSFAYRHTAALSRVRFSVPAGKVVAFVGSSGSGKSTVARLAARLFDPDFGSVSIGGVDLRTFSSEQLGHLVATVFQDPALFSDTIAANIRVGREEASDAEVEHAARLAQAHEFISALPDGYATTLIEGGKNLSIGQRQRIAIARAIVSKAPLLILDEITSFTDPETETLVQQALSNLVGNRTILVIAHRLRTIAGADAIHVLDDGQIAESGTHSDLISRGGVYARLWKSQADEKSSPAVATRRAVV